MSFRKRGEIIGGVPARAPAVPGRNPAIPGRSLPIVGRAPAGVTSSVRNPATRSPISKPDRAPDVSSIMMNNPGVRPSLSTSQPTTSTGTSDLD